MDKLQRLGSAIMRAFRGQTVDGLDLDRNEVMLEAITKAKSSIEEIRAHFPFYGEEERESLRADIDELQKEIDNLEQLLPVKADQLEALLFGQDSFLRMAIVKHYIAGEPWENLSEDPENLKEQALVLLKKSGVSWEA